VGAAVPATVFCPKKVADVGKATFSHYFFYPLAWHRKKRERTVFTVVQLQPRASQGWGRAVFLSGF